MRMILSAAMLVALPMSLGTVSSSASAAMTSASCQPLTVENQKACCADPRWSTLIQQGDKQFCSRRSATDKVRLGRKLNSRSGQIPPNDDVPTGSLGKPASDGEAGSSVNGNTDNSGVGNPGNGKSVGNAGEKGMDSDDSPSGTRGNSN